jgi:hypothetical protein
MVWACASIRLGKMIRARSTPNVALSANLSCNLISGVRRVSFAIGFRCVEEHRWWCLVIWISRNDASLTVGVPLHCCCRMVMFK